MSGEPPKISKGSIVLIWFPFTDFSDKKLRPALVLFEGYLDVTVVYISGEIPLCSPETFDFIYPSKWHGKEE